MADEIERFWQDPRHQASPTWEDHRDINQVMLATSLHPEGFLRADWSDVATSEVKEK